MIGVRTANVETITNGRTKKIKNHGYGYFQTKNNVKRKDERMIL